MNIENLKTQITETKKGVISYCTLPSRETIDDASDFLDVMANSGAGIIAVDKDTLTSDFFDLKTGVAGDILQKVSNYRKQFIILGDFDNFGSKNFQSFISESNRGRTVLFVDNIESALKLL